MTDVAFSFFCLCLLLILVVWTRDDR